MTAEPGGRFRGELLRELLKAGWTPNRRETALVAKWELALCGKGGFRMTSAARRVLEEFGGLVFPARYAGECNRPLVLDPMCSEGDEDEYTAYGEALGRPLFPLGDTPYDYVSIAEDGTVYLLGSGDVFLAGETFDEALAKILNDGPFPEIPIRRPWEK